MLGNPAAHSRRVGIGLADIFSAATDGGEFAKTLAASDLQHGRVSHVLSSTVVHPNLDESLLKLGEAAAALLSITSGDDRARALLQQFARRYLHAIQAAGAVFSDIVHRNVRKIHSRFADPILSEMPKFDDVFDLEEQLPWHFEIKITQRKSGQSYLQWNEVFVGAPLTDNILDKDGYRFHDVFHLAHAAILHWSPTFRALIKQKRKSNKEYDEAQDGGRAIVVEEGLTAYIFSRAKKHNYFMGQDRVSYDLLKTVQQFVRGYERDRCPLRLWEMAIIRGYDVFRAVRAQGGGIVIGDREKRTIEYRKS